MTTKKPKAVSGKIHLKWIRSAICAPVKQKLVVKGLGFTRLNQVIERPDNPAIRGMVAKVSYLLEVKETPEEFKPFGRRSLAKAQRESAKGAAKQG